MPSIEMTSSLRCGGFGSGGAPARAERDPQRAVRRAMARRKRNNILIVAWLLSLAHP
jgi:hypothetical protein